MTLQPEQVPPGIMAMHREYERLTGGPLTLNWPRMDQWRIFLKFRTPEFTAQDLRIVVAHIQRGIREQRRNTGALKFHNLIGQPDYFEEDLNEAKAMARAIPPANKTVTYNGTQRVVPNPGTGDATISLAEVIAKMREAVG